MYGNFPWVLVLFHWTSIKKFWIESLSVVLSVFPKDVAVFSILFIIMISIFTCLKKLYDTCPPILPFLSLIHSIAVFLTWTDVNVMGMLTTVTPVSHLTAACVCQRVTQWEIMWVTNVYLHKTVISFLVRCYVDQMPIFIP